MIKKFKFLFFIMVSMFIFDLCLADVIGTKTDENYTYTPNSEEDIVYTSTMVFTSDYLIQLDTETATGLTVKSENINVNPWYNDTPLFINGNIEIDNIWLLNESSITATTLTISSTGYMETFADNLALANGITNKGFIYIDGGKNTNVITGSTGTIIFNINTEETTVSTNSANIEQYEVASQGEFYNEAKIKATNYENYGLTYSSGTVEVSSFTNNGTFFNEFEGTGGTINATEIINNYNLITNIENIVTSNEIKNNGYFEITGGTNTYKITGSSGTIAFGSDETGIVGNTNEIQQSTMYVRGIFTNEGKITINENIIILEKAELSTDISSISVTNNSIINYGKLNLFGDGENNNYINGYYVEEDEEVGIIKGTTTITGNIINNNGIIQSYIINKGTITTSFENIYTDDKFINDGKLIISGNESYNSNIIEGTGVLEISTNVANLASIKQKELLINTDIYFYNKTDIEVSSLTNNGTFINELENEDETITEGTITATKIINNGFIRTNIANIQTTDSITNEGSLYITGGKNTNIITGSSGTVVFNISTTTISTNSANIEQYEVASQGEFYNEAKIKANNYENYGLTYSSGTIEVSTFTNNDEFINKANIISDYFENSIIIDSSGTIISMGEFENAGTIEVSSFTNNGTFINELENEDETITEGTITATKIINNGFIRTNIANIQTTDSIINEGSLYIAGGKNRNIITGSSGTVVFNISTTTISTNSANIEQYEVASQGEFYNEAKIKATNYENYGLTYSSGTVEVSSFTNNGTFFNEFEGTGGTINATEIINNYNLITNIENIVTSNEIKNNGYFEITGGTNTYKITGSSGTIAFGSDETGIVGNTNEIQQSTMYVRGIFTNEGKITINENIIILEKAELSTDISSISVTNNSIINYGKLNLFGDGENNNYINGYYVEEDEEVGIIKGTTTITGNIINNNGIIQSYIINKGTITSSFENIYAADKLINDGKIKILGNQAYNQNNIEGTGILEISTNVVNGALITQKQLIINEAAFFQTSMDNLNIEEGIINNGLIYSTGGKNTNVITGSSGTIVFNISTATVSTNSANIEQYEVASQGEFYNEAKIKANSYENYGLTYSSGTIDVSTFTNNGTFTNEFEGTGGTISAAEIINNYNLITNIENLQVTSNEIKNNGYLEITGGTNTYKITGSSGTIAFGSDENSIVGNTNEIQQSTMYVRGVFTNEGNIELTDSLIIVTSGSLTNLSTITAQQNIYNYGTVVNKSSMTILNIFLNSGNLNNEQTIYSTNYFVNYGTTTNTGKITAIEIDNGTDGLFETDINNIEVSSEIINYGKLNLSGDGENKNYIVGEGTITIKGEIINNNTIAQNCIINEGTITTKLENIYVSSKIINNGEMTISKDSKYYHNTNNFEGTGILNISTNIYNTATIQQNSVFISSSSEFYTKADLLDVTNLNNNGFLVFSDESAVNKSTITGSGVLYLLGNIENSGQIEQTAVVIYQNYSFTTAGNMLKAKYMVNNGTLNLSDGNINLVDTFLEGSGKITGDVVIGSSSTFSPGNSIGYFVVRGNLTFDSNSTYRAEFSEDDSDYTIAYGSITINSGSKADFVNLSGKYFEHKTYGILWTTNTLSGSFDEISFSGYDIDVSSTSDLRETRVGFSTKTVDGEIQVILARKGTNYSTSDQLTDMTDAQKAVAEAVDIISLKSNNGSIANLLSTLESYYYYNSTYNVEKLKDIFTSLSGTIYANSAIAPFLNARYEHIYDKIYRTEEIKDYIDEYYEDGEEYYETKRNFWTQYYYNYYDVSGNQTYSSYDDTVQGFYAGYDISSSKNKLLGIVAGYADGLLKQKYDKTKVKSANLGAYVGYTKSKFQLKSLAMLGYDMYETERQTHATADYNGYSFSFDAEASYNVVSREKFEIKPFAGILANISKQDSFTEKNAESLNLSVEENTNFLSQIRVGAEVKGKINLLNLYARVGIKQFLTQNYAEAKIKIADTGTNFNLKGTELSSTTFNIGVGGDYYLSEYWTAFANIHFGIGFGNSNDYYGNIGVKYKFGVVNREKDYIIR